MRKRDEARLVEDLKSWSQQKLNRELKNNLHLGYCGLNCFKNITESYHIYRELEKRLKSGNVFTQEVRKRSSNSAL